MNEELEQFLIAQQTYYRTALQEIKSGQKRSCWMWFIFPQIAGLGYSETARYYAIKDLYHKYESITADAGYENEENYLWMEKEEIVMYVPGTGYYGMLAGKNVPVLPDTNPYRMSIVARTARDVCISVGNVPVQKNTNSCMCQRSS